MLYRRGLIAVCLAALTASPSLAQQDSSKYPSRPIHIIVGFAAGGGNDVIARIYGQKLSEDLGQPVIVENKPGGGAIVATDYVAKAAPDGYTLLVGASGMAINQSLYAKLPYDSVRDFVAISEIASFPLIMIVNASSPVKSVADFVTYAKADADKMNYASSSASFQLVTELFKQKTGAPMQAIPYKSANESVLAVVSGQVTTTIADAGPVSPQVKAGTVRALAIAARSAWRNFPTCRP
jgi:tripartite-type tricarboxylate transporter receptor subunit TctC